MAVKAVTGLPSAEQLLDLGLHAPAMRYLRYQFPGDVELRALEGIQDAAAC